MIKTAAENTFSVDADLCFYVNKNIVPKKSVRIKSAVNSDSHY
ncbi:MAG TPA: hypothetical protein VMW66_04515 [Elusimicrobiales bacterium]|nr:hypothetical protein [Elusimicrobiales bacterium]